MKSLLHITFAAALGSAAVLATNAYPQATDQQQRPSGYSEAAESLNDIGRRPPPADEAPQRRHDSGYPTPGTSADSGSGASTPAAEVPTGRGAVPNPAAGATPLPNLVAPNR